MENDVEILYKDYKKSIEHINEKIDIAFIDPPYEKDIAVKSIQLILENGILQKDGLIILETDNIERELKELNNINNIKIVDIRQYGRVKLIFLNQTEIVKNNDLLMDIERNEI